MRIILSIILSIVLFGCFINIAIPKTDNSVIVGGNNVNLRVNPNTKSNVIMLLEMGQFVTIIKESNEIVTIDNMKGKWVYVDTNIVNSSSSDGVNDAKTYKGWVFDYFLYYKSKFKRVNSFNPTQIEVHCEGGDIYFELYVKSDATFTEKNIYMLGGSSDHEKYCKESCGYYNKSEPNVCYFKGALYQCNNIIWAKTDNVKDGGNDFYILSDSKELIYISHGSNYSVTDKIKK